MPVQCVNRQQFVHQPLQKPIEKKGKEINRKLDAALQLLERWMYSIYIQRISTELLNDYVIDIFTVVKKYFLSLEKLG